MADKPDTKPPAPESATQAVIGILDAVEIALAEAVDHADRGHSISEPADDEYMSEALDALASVDDMLDAIQARLRVARMDLADISEERAREVVCEVLTPRPGEDQAAACRRARQHAARVKEPSNG